MKKSILFKAIACCFILATGCQQPKTDEAKSCKQEVDSLKKELAKYTKKDPKALQDWCDPNATTNKSAHYIQLIEAVNYAWDYVRIFESIPTTLGGFVEISQEKIDSVKKSKSLDEIRCGLLAYFIFEDSKFKLAWKLIGDLDENKSYYPLSSDQDAYPYVKSVCSNVYNQSDVTNQASLISALTNYDRACNEITVPIMGRDIGPKAETFKMRINNSLAGTIDEPIAFFHKDQIESLLALQGCKGLRIYWGFDTNALKNKIKLVVFGIGADNKNIPIDYKILERSWPPY